MSSFCRRSLWCLLLITADYAAHASSVLAADNPIIVENRRVGTTDWRLAKTQVNDDHRSRAIEGYASHPSIRAGQTLSVYVSTHPPSSYRVDIYRMGHYGGTGARHMQSLGPFDGIEQPDPKIGDDNVRECRWSRPLELPIPETWLSGVYLGKLTADPSGLQSYIVFIVRDERRADFLFQCSDMTWQAYNRWPAWSSLYDYEDKRWETQRSNAISWDRPYSRYFNGLPANIDAVTPIVGSGEFLLWEFPLAYWMEARGDDVTYISNLDTHNDRDGLLRAKGFLSIGHDEYWTERMIENVAWARDAGLNLAFLGGNSLWHCVYLKPSAAGQPDRIFGREQRFETEQQLMGASSYGVGLADWTCRKADHWVFAGTGLRNGDAIRGLVGWEYHGPPLRDDPDLIVLARGHVADSNGKMLENEYAATIYDGPKGNFVFNAGTCWWNMPLASPPGFINPNRADFREDDARVQRMTQNILDRIRQSPHPQAP